MQKHSIYQLGQDEERTWGLMGYDDDDYEIYVGQSKSASASQITGQTLTPVQIDHALKAAKSFFENRLLIHVLEEDAMMVCLEGTTPDVCAERFFPSQIKSSPLLTEDLGWSKMEALEIRNQLASFEVDWDAPGMELYDEL